MQYQLLLPSGCIENIYGQANDSALFKFKARQASEYGNLKLSFSVDDSTKMYVLQLLDKKDKVVLQKVVEPGLEYSLEFLTPKEYSIRIIEDLNQNEKWDGGDYDKKIQPERVYYYKEPVKLRPNWDMKIELEVSF